MCKRDSIVTVNDGACPIPAIQTYVYTVRVLAGLAATITTTDEACTGTADGTATTSIVTGSPPYTYSWSNGATTSSITAGPGIYSVTISDGNNCVSPVSYTHLRAHETVLDIVCRLLLEQKKKQII